jgi:hypothetical protein
MAFNVGDFVKGTAKSALNKLVDNVVGNVVSGLPMNSKLAAKSTAESLINAGASYTQVEAMSALKVDNITSGAAPEFFAIAGKDVSRASAAIGALRHNSDSTDSYLNNVNPETKMAKRRSKDEYEVHALL